MRESSCRVCGVRFLDPVRPGRPRSLCGAHQSYRRRRGPYRVVCPCGTEFEAVPTPGVPRRFCSEAHKRATGRAGRYGLTGEEFFRMVSEHSGRCDICGDAFEAAAFHIDHDHETGSVRGLLCGGCNLGLGHFRDSVALLDSAKAYLTRQEIVP